MQLNAGSWAGALQPHHPLDTQRCMLTARAGCLTCLVVKPAILHSHFAAFVTSSHGKEAVTLCMLRLLKQLAEGLSCLERHGCMQARASSDTGVAWLAASDHVCPVQHIARFLFFLFNGTSADRGYCCSTTQTGCSGAAHAPPLIFHVRLQTCSC